MGLGESMDQAAGLNRFVQAQGALCVAAPKCPSAAGEFDPVAPIMVTGGWNRGHVLDRTGAGFQPADAGEPEAPGVGAL